MAVFMSARWFCTTFLWLICLKAGISLVELTYFLTFVGESLTCRCGSGPTAFDPARADSASLSV